MKALTVARNSWIYKLAKFGEFDEHWSGSTSICELNTAIMWGVGKLLGFAWCIAFFGFFMLSPVYYGVLYFIDPVANSFIAVVQKQPFVVGLCLDIFVFLMACVYFYTESDYCHRKWQDSNQYQIESSKISLQWQAFKDKVCIKVDFR